ncbi:MAG TPA: hypothetical protein VFC84_04485 [Desulfosporosinus sp.]|nr:hypothetical protein [Desulfosporosinus sp.]
MSTRRVFWALVHNDARLGFTIRREDKSLWRFLVLVIFLVGVAVYASDLFAEWVTVALNFIASPSAGIFAYLMVSTLSYTILRVPQEWTKRTVGWWLSLPYSRRLLLAAKSAAGMFSFLNHLLIVVIATTLLVIFKIYLHPEVGNISLLQALPQRILYNFVIALLLSPFFVILSITLSILGKSKANLGKWQMKILSIFLKILVVAIVLATSFLIYPVQTVISPESFRSVSWNYLSVIIGVSMGLSAILFFLSAYVLEHKVDI